MLSCLLPWFLATASAPDATAQENLPKTAPSAEDADGETAPFVTATRAFAVQYVAVAAVTPARIAVDVMTNAVTAAGMAPSNVSAVPEPVPSLVPVVAVPAISLVASVARQESKNGIARTVAERAV